MSTNWLLCSTQPQDGWIHFKVCNTLHWMTQVSRQIFFKNHWNKWLQLSVCNAKQEGKVYHYLQIHVSWTVNVVHLLYTCLLNIQKSEFWSQNYFRCKVKQKQLFQLHRIIRCFPTKMEQDYRSQGSAMQVKSKILAQNRGWCPCLLFQTGLLSASNSSCVSKPHLFSKGDSGVLTHTFCNTKLTWQWHN